MPFAAAVDAMFLGAMGSDALYTPVGGAQSADPIRVILSQPDTFTPVFDVSVVSASTQVEVRTSEVPALRHGDSLALLDTDGVETGEVLTINGKPRRDDTRLIWVASSVEG